jgi:hypothetical protein
MFLYVLCRRSGRVSEHTLDYIHIYKQIPSMPTVLLAACRLSLPLMNTLMIGDQLSMLL